MPERDTPTPPDLREIARRASERLDDAPRSQGDGSDNGGSADEDSSAWFELASGSTTAGPDPEADKLTLDPPESLLQPGAKTDSPSLSNPTPSTRGGTTSLSELVSTPTYRPTRRPPMAILRVYDDDQRDAEVVRVRQTPFVIGRQDGELVIGHERQMSRRHARLDRTQEGDVWRWYLSDLRSTNGTFHCVDQAPLHDGTEVLIGGELVRFAESSTGGHPSLTKVAPSADEEQVKLTGEAHLIGVDASTCLPFLTKSTYLDPHHYRVERRAGRWWVVDLGSTNHLWVSITKRIELSAEARFQIGEQRFSFHLP